MPRVAVAWGSAQTQPWVREVFRLTSRVFPSSWHPPPICSCPPFNLSAILGHPMSAVSAPLSPGPLLTSVTCWPLEVCLPWAWWWEGRGDRDALAPGARRLVGAHAWALSVSLFRLLPGVMEESVEGRPTGEIWAASWRRRRQPRHGPLFSSLLSQRGPQAPPRRCPRPALPFPGGLSPAARSSGATSHRWKAPRLLGWRGAPSTA